MAARPAIAPLAMPRDAGLPSFQLRNIQVRAPAAAAVLVTTKALAARPFAANALPALKPNQPNQSMEAPSSAIGMLLGSMRSLPKPTRLPMTSRMASAEKPALMWTTTPPAKSIAPSWASQPPPHTQWAMGSYTNVLQRSPKMMKEESLTLSANTDVNMASVTAANTIWNAMNASAGIVEFPTAVMPTPLSPMKSSPPMMPCMSGPNTRL